MASLTLISFVPALTLAAFNGTALSSASPHNMLQDQNGIANINLLIQVDIAIQEYAHPPLLAVAGFGGYQIGDR